MNNLLSVTCIIPVNQKIVGCLGLLLLDGSFKGTEVRMGGHVGVLFNIPHKE